MPGIAFEFTYAIFKMANKLYRVPVQIIWAALVLFTVQGRAVLQPTHYSSITLYPIYQRSFLFIFHICIRTSKFLPQNGDFRCFLVACRTHFFLKLCSDYYYLPSSDEWFCRISCMVDTRTAHCLFCGASRTAPSKPKF